MSYKQEKIIVIISEFLNDKREFYPITDVPIEKAKFFYKDDNGLFKAMSSSDYSVRTEVNEIRLYITNEKIKNKSSKFQMGYEINFSASEYETSLPVLSVLVEMYNTLVEDSRTIFNYVKKQCFISDDKNNTLILPYLPPNCVWCMGDNNEMYALPVNKLYEKFEEMVEAVYKNVYKLLKADKDKFSEELSNELLKHIEEGKNDLTSHTETKKIELNDYVKNDSIVKIDNHVVKKKEEIDTYIEENKANLKGEKGDTGKSIEYSWKGTELGIRQEGEPEYNYVNLKGDTGKGLEFEWKDTELGVRIAGNETYIYRDLKGEEGKRGPQGKGLQYNWKNTQLGIKVEGDKSFTYTDLKGIKGDRGEKGVSIENITLKNSNGNGDNIYDISLSNGDKKEIIAPRGPQGKKGDKGDRGDSGAIVETSGLYCFTVKEDGCLYLIYQGNKRPNFYINENGNLIYSTESYFPQQKKLVINLTQDDFKNNRIGNIKLYNGNNLLTTFGNNKNESYNENDLCYNSQEGFFFIGRNKESIYINIKEFDLFNATKKLTIEFQFSQTDIANDWSNPLFLTSMENFIHDSGDTQYRIAPGVRLEWFNRNGGVYFCPSPFTDGTDEKISPLGIVNDKKHSIIITIENTKAVVYFDYIKIGECNIYQIPKINYIGLNRGHGTNRCCNMKVYGLKVWKDTILTEQEIEYIKNSEVI